MNEMEIGMLVAFGAVLFFGSYAVPMKLPAVMSADFDPVVFQAYKSLACFTTSCLALLFVPLKFTWWGIAGATIWVMTGIGAIMAVQRAGIAAAQSLWSGLSVVVSYIWGAYIFHEPIQDKSYSLLALTLMAVGMIIVGGAASGSEELNIIQKKLRHHLCQRLGYNLAKNCQDLTDTDTVRVGLIFHENEKVDGIDKDEPTNVKDDKQEKFLHGIWLSVFVGISNGSFLIPLQYANKDVVGLQYLFSFGVGALSMTSLVLAIYFLFLICSGKSCPSFQFSVIAGPALGTGLMWSGGNVCSIYATLFLGYSLGWPLVQCQLLVSALWAVFYYKEVNKTAVTYLFGGSLLVVVGAILLTRFGTHK